MSSVATEPNPNGTQTQLPAQRQLPASSPRREIRVVEDDGPVAFLMDTARFEHMQRIAQLMGAASLLPDHLKFGKNGPLPQEQVVANCFLIVNQALRWKMDPFAVAPETYSVGGKLAFQGKLVAALVNSRAGLKRNLNYQFSGSGAERALRVVGEFENENTEREAIVVLKDVRTKNEMWTKDPDQKLIYTGAIKWARRHCPEVLLGVLTDDDLERIQERTIDVHAEHRRERPSLDDLAERLTQSSEAASEQGEQTPTEASSDKPASAGELRQDVSTFHDACAAAKLVREVEESDAALRGPNGRTLDDAEAALADAWKSEALERIRNSRGERSNQKTLTE